MILVLAPTQREARAIGPPVRVCGAGQDATPTSRDLLERVRPDAIVLFGVCGALDPSLRSGDLVLVRGVHGTDLEARSELREAAALALRARRARFVGARVMHAERPLTRRREKAQSWNDTGAACVDMETAAVAAAATNGAVPWIAIRAVVDPASMSLPGALADWRPGGERDIARRILASPRDWAALPRLALAERRAHAALRQAAAIVVPAVERVMSARAAPQAVSSVIVR